MEITTIAASGLLAADRAAQVRANNIVNAFTSNYTPLAPVFSPIVSGGGVALMVQNAEGPVNLIAETIGLNVAAEQYKAAASLLGRADELRAQFLQTFA